MCNLKLWSLLLPIVLLSLEYKRSVVAGKGSLLSFDRLFGGFVGCIWQNVCRDDEICVDDYLFGKCKTKQEVEPIRINRLSRRKAEQLEDALNRFDGIGIDWSDLQLQCILRSILTSHDALDVEDFARMCGLPPMLDDEETNSDLVIPVGDQFSDNSPFIRPTRSISRKLKRYPLELDDHDDRSKTNGEQETKDYEQITQANREAESQLSRAQFDRELKRIIWQLNRQGHGGLKDRSSNDRHYSTEYVTALPDGRPSKDRSKRLNQQNGGALKRRYQLRLPDDLHPLPQRTRSWVWTKFYRRSLNTYEAEQFLKELFYRLNLASPIPTFHLDKTGNVLYFQVPATTGTTADAVAKALREGKGDFEGFHTEQVGFGRGTPLYPAVEDVVAPRKYTATLVVCLSILFVVVVLFLAYGIQLCRTKIRNRLEERSGQRAALIKPDKSKVTAKSSTTKTHSSQSLMHKIGGFFERHTNPKWEKGMSHIVTEPCQIPPMQEKIGQPLGNPTEYRYSKDTILSEVSNFADNKRKSTMEHKDSLTSQTSSNYSWSSEPVSCGIDVTTGHLILSYMETYLREDSRLNADWEAVNAYDSEEATPCVDAQKPENLMRNRLIAPLPYEQSRVRLRSTDNDYINASLIYDHSPRNPVYIATPTPLIDTLADFWQMIWEQCSVVLVCLEHPADLKKPENEFSDNELVDACIQYWPSEGTRVYGNFEVHLVSEHSSCDKYVVRSFYLKNLQSSETRTVTQFHYLTWADEKLKSETKSLLDFRRKVNRSFRGMMSPIVVHCQDGSGRTGTYILLDMVLNRITKGVKEINIAASLEHLRDQRQSMVRTKEQYEFVFTAVAHEVDVMLKMNNLSG